VVCMGRDYWQHMQRFLRDTMLASGTISATDLDLALVTDDPLEAVRYIQENIIKPEPLREESQDVY